MSEHTPGPWTHNWYVNGDYFSLTGANGKSIIDGCGCCDSPWCPNPADAKLIAAAPDLLEALKEIADHHESQRELWSSEENADADQAEYHEDRRNFALASIAKATGGDV